jgi:S-methylmethionine-dependent homocysteine/selenocysteine methylase
VDLSPPPVQVGPITSRLKDGTDANRFTAARPTLISSLIGELVQVTRKPIIVYPNSGEQWDAVHRCWLGDGQIDAFGELARRWRAEGAQWIGGCCRTGPEHLRAVAEVWRD